MKLFQRKSQNRWLVLDQSFFSLFLPFSLIELSNVGAGLIDGLIVSNFLDAEAMAAAGIDLRVVYDPRELILRTQDNCPTFNVEREIAMAISEGAADPEEHLGLKILSGLAEDIKYVHSLETNNVILRFPLRTAEAEP